MRFTVYKTVVELTMTKVNQDCKECFTAGTNNAKHKFIEEKNSNGCSYFFKVLLGDFSQRLRIPPAFVPNIIHEADANTVLHDPSGHQWIVKLCGTSTGMEFGQGWGNFVHNQRLETGDFLVFKYVCRSNFKVWIFGRSGCEKNIISCESAETHYNLQKRRPVNPAMGSFHQLMNSHLQIGLVSDKEEQNRMVGNQGKRPKSSSSSHGRSSGHCQQSLTGKKRKLEESSAERGYKKNYYISSRRPVTETERNKALKAANSFTSDKPFCLILLKPSHVYRDYWLGMPKTCIDHLQLPKEKTEVTLVDDKNKEWPVRFIWNDYKNGLSKGWRHFSLANNLEEGDVCIFECVDNIMEKIKLKVHIFRVIKKRTPYKRMEGKKLSDSIALPTNQSKKMRVSRDCLLVNLPAKALTLNGKDAKREIKQVKKMNNSISFPRNHSKKRKLSEEDLVTNLSAKASGPEQGKNSNQGIKEVKEEEEEENTSNLDYCSKLANSKCTQAISERKMGYRRSPRFAQTSDIVMKTC